MTTFTVINNADSGAGTLRSYLGIAKDGDTINFAPSVQLITLANPLEIKTGVTIEGSQPTAIGTPGVVITGNSVTREFTVDSGVSTKIDGVELSYGHNTGSSPAPLTYMGGTTAAGAIYDSGTLTLSDSLVDHNTGQGFTGTAGFSGGGQPGGTGVGGIYVASGATLNLVGSTNSFEANTGMGGTGGQGAIGSYDRTTMMYDPGGLGGKGAVAKSGMTKTPAQSGSAGGGYVAGAGAGGAPYQAGQDGTGGAPSGGGGGGNAFADYSGVGTVNIIPVCFANGTLIRTARGDLAVEHLAVGDLVVTASGASRPIRWLGHRTIDCRRHLRPQEAWPIRLVAHAFGTKCPVRDLFLSPGHPVLVGADENGEGGHLVPIMCLINGTTIERVAVDEVTYWHVELDQHDILLAEGLPAESYVDLGSRPWFDGANGALYDPDMAAPGMPGRCRPVAIDGPVVEAERRRLDAVFALRLETACAWPSEDASSVAL